MCEMGLNMFKEPLKHSLALYERSYDNRLRFEDLPDFELTPDKPNTARTIIPVTYAGTNVGKLYAIIFFPGDGTGDAKTYEPGRLEVPSRLRYSEKPERVMPRSKSGIICEGYFPFFSFSDGRVSMCNAFLEELTVDDVDQPERIVHAWNLGNRESKQPEVYLTTGYDKHGSRFGDPHSIHNYGDDVEVVGFLAITDRENPLLQLTDRWILPPHLRQA